MKKRADVVTPKMTITKFRENPDGSVLNMKVTQFMKRWRGVAVLITGVVYLTSLTSGLGYGATREDLQTQINLLGQAVKAETKQGIDVLNALTVLTAPAQSLTTGIVQGLKGTTINLPVYYKEGTKQAAGLQFDLAIPSGLTPVSVAPGIAAQAAGKSAQGNIVQGGYRIIIFGLNQTLIPSGPVGIVRVQIGATAGLGKRGVSILNLSASDPNGVSVPVTGKNGSVTIQ